MRNGPASQKVLNVQNRTGICPSVYFHIFCCPAYLHSVSLCYRFAGTLLPFATGRWSPRVLLVCLKDVLPNYCGILVLRLAHFCCLYSRRALQCILAEQPPLKYSHWSVLTFLRHPARILYIPASLRPPQHLFRCGAGCLFLLDVYIVHSSIQLCNSNNVFVCFLL